jgi:acetyl esterase/lipase
MLSRRSFLALAPGAVFAASSISLGASEGLQITDPGCPADAYAGILDGYREMRSRQVQVSEEQRLRESRAGLAGQPVLDLRPGERADWMVVPGSPPVRVRVLRPPTVQGVVLSIHGGGWAVGSALSDEVRHWQWARQAQIAVVSPEYRLAPEHPYPAGPDDCEAVARWLIAQSSALFGSSRLALSGASAGAHLAALTLQRLPLELRSAFLCAVLYYGVYDLGRSPVWRQASDADFPDLRPSDMDLFLRWFLPGLTDRQRRQPRYSPMRGDLKGMPPALFLVGGADLLAHDSQSFARRWADHGNPAELVEYPGAPHGFNGFDVECGIKPDLYAAQFLQRYL